MVGTYYAPDDQLGIPFWQTHDEIYWETNQNRAARLRSSEQQQFEANMISQAQRNATFAETRQFEQAAVDYLDAVNSLRWYFGITLGRF